MVTLDVEIRPSIGVAETPAGNVKVEHNQWEVWAGNPAIKKNYGKSPVMVGFAGKETGTVEFCGHVRNWGAAHLQKICDEVARLTNTEERQPLVPMAPVLTKPVEEIPDEPAGVIELEDASESVEYDDDEAE